MSDNDSKYPADDSAVPLVTEQVQPQSNFAKAKQAAQKSRKPATSAGRGKAWLLLLLLALIGGAAIWGWFNWPQLREQVAEHLRFIPGIQKSEQPPAASREPPSDPQPATAESQPQAPEQSMPASDNSAALREQLQQQQQAITQLQQQLGAMQRSLTAQGSRLNQLGNVSREDWQLAEADYLLRLANQRLLLERDSRAALGLAEQVDSIVRQVDLPDLYGVRQQLAQDLTALKLVENIDREGLYLQLRALQDQMLRLSIQPEFNLATRDPAEQEQTKPPQDASVWRNSWNNFLGFLQNSVRIRDGSIDPVLLSPQSEARFRQNLRLNMEQAELALLRGDGTVYKDSLNRARQLLSDYGIDNHQRQVIVRELQELSQQPVDVELPSLNASQSALRNYIERLHKTGAQNEPASQTPTEEPQVRFPDSAQPENLPGDTIP
jgi:uncharacterized protein HemX